MTESRPLLVVDDDPINRDLLSRRLERRGYTVHSVASGVEALAYLAAHPVEMVLLDIQMPTMSGLEVLQQIRQRPASAHLPVLMVSAGHQSEDVVTALELGADDYLTKPIDFPVALARIRTQLLRRRAEDALRESEERYALAALGANDGLWDWAVPANEIYFSERWAAVIGHRRDDIGTGPEEWFGRIHPEDQPRVRRDLDAHLSGATEHFESEHRLRHKTGTFRWVLARGIAVRNDLGTVTRVAGSLTDITAGKVVDALTGLPNRTLLVDRLKRDLEHCGVHARSQFAVLFLDLDGFKVINDSLGHQAGDELLTAVARRLEGALRTTDVLARASGDLEATRQHHEHTFARVGGDEFIILLHNISHVLDATLVAERVHRALVAPFDVAGREVFTTASVGIAMSATGYSSPDEVLRDADTAMYRAKALGKGRTEVFDGAMREQVVQRLQLDTAVRRGLERHEFVPFFQPVVSLQSGGLVGFEALLRWWHPDRGQVSPAEFLPVIQQNGLARAVGQQLLTDVCAQLRRWRDAAPGAAPLLVHVNFSSRELADADLVPRLLECLADHALEPGHLVAEVAEGTVADDYARMAGRVEELERAGIRVVMDAFGTGCSSLASLHELPISGVKFDATFARAGGKRQAVFGAVVALARSLGLTVTVEGIDTAEQHDRVRALGCDFAQGGLYAPALTPDAALAALASRRFVALAKPA